MPMSDNLNRTIWTAVHAFERTQTPAYPQRFPNIDAAKLFIQALCDAAAFDYGLPLAYNLRASDPHHIVRLVKDRVCFLVAVRAHDQGEFYLDEALPDRQKPRDAVEAEIPRLTALIQTWPPTFASADVAAKYVAGVAALRRFVYASFESVSEEKFRAYVAWNTARRTWEGDGFEMERVPRGWKRRASPTMSEKCCSMTDAIDFDIARLRTLIPCDAWPATFSDLNAARNFVGQWCYDNRFRYAGWPDVELRKYRLYVNFNAAKYALEAGVFEVERAVAPLAKSHAKKSVVPKDDVEVIEMKASANEESKGTPVFDLCSRTEYNNEDWNLVDNLSSTRAYPSVPTFLSSSEIAGESAPLTPASPEPERGAAPVDPFKDLIAELQRGYILKVAFE